jgi:hypothetical protein
MLLRPAAAEVEVHRVALTVECVAATLLTVKLREALAAPLVALTATLDALLDALVGDQVSGFVAASAPAETARNVVLTVR